MIRRDLYECRMVAWCEALKGSVLYGMVKCIPVVKLKVTSTPSRRLPNPRS